MAPCVYINAHSRFLKNLETSEGALTKERRVVMNRLKVKRLINVAKLSGISALLVVAFSSTSWGAGELVPVNAGYFDDSLHNFELAQQLYDEIVQSRYTSCLVCHGMHPGPIGGPITPPGPIPDLPLNAHDLTGATFTPYSGYDMQSVPGQPGPNSKFCLSCHDGTVAITSSGGFTGTVFMADVNPAAVVGTDLTNDHPVGIPYDPALAAADTELVDPTTITLPLFGGQIECSTCHDVHNTRSALNNNPVLLNIGLSNGALCLECHNK